MKINFIQKIKDSETYWLVERGRWLWKEYLMHFTHNPVCKFLTNRDIDWYMESYNKPIYTKFHTLEEAREKVEEVVARERAAKEKVIKRLKFDY